MLAVIFIEHQSNLIERIEYRMYEFHTIKVSWPLFFILFFFISVFSRNSNIFFQLQRTSFLSIFYVICLTYFFFYILIL